MSNPASNPEAYPHFRDGHNNDSIAWGPQGQTVYERTYSRPKPDGSRETWPETVARVVDGNLGLVYGDPSSWDANVHAEAEELYEHILNFKVMPAGRHLWSSGVKGRTFLMNCWTSGWYDKLSDHYEFTFARLMEGGGVGSNYSSRFLRNYGLPQRDLQVHIVCSPEHKDYATMLGAGVLSSDYSHEWDGAFQVEDSREGWAAALVDLIDTYMTTDTVKHSNRVYDISNVRPAGAPLKTFGGTASGPLPFALMMHKVSRVLNGATARRRDDLRSVTLDVTDGDIETRVHIPQAKIEVQPGQIYFAPTFVGAQYITPIEAMLLDHAIAECVVSGGVRRSARMSIVHWNDPYVFDFIECKRDSGEHWTTNISVEIDDEFLAALADDEHPLHEQAARVHHECVKAMYTNGEPGYWNSSLSNVGEVEPVFATNPCGEICLHASEPCCLCHVNLDAFAPTEKNGYANEGGLIRAHELATRFAVRATYAGVVDPKSRAITDKNRRIGVGHLGVQDFIVKHGWKYSDVATDKRSNEFYAFRALLERLRAAVNHESREYAFELRIPAPIKTTTVAPTGSISKLPGVGGEGIHVIYARFYEQRIRFAKNDPQQMQTVRDAEANGYKVEVDSYDATGNTLIVVYPTKNALVEKVEALGYDGSIVEQADELSLSQALAFQAMYQTHYANNAVSFTVNVPAQPHQNEYMVANPFGTDIPAPTDDLIREASDIIESWLPLLKGTTIMVDGTRPQAPFTRISEDELVLDVQVGDGIDMDCSTGACPIR